uniref:Uncharacterized protein n=1 Tax=Schizaphis graminum TaxID=13262 RepID=A0A2S2PNB7_SCHGA
MHWKGDKTKRTIYFRRLRKLNEKLKPYRNMHTIDSIRVITQSSKLDRHWETLENVLTEGHTYDDVKKCLQKVANKITANGVYNGKRMTDPFDMTMDLVENMKNIDVNSTAMTINEIKPFKINSPALFPNTVNPFKINSSAICINTENPLKINLSTNYANTVNRDDIEPTDIVINKFNHMHLNGCKCYRK